METMNMFSNLMSNSEMRTPEVGMGATACYYSDRHAFTIIKVTPKTILIQRDIATRTDNNGMGDAQSYSYQFDATGGIFKATLRSNGKWKLAGQSTTVLIDTRKEFYDYGF